MPNNITDREAVSINDHEFPDATLGQLHGRMCTAGSKTDTQHGFVIENCRFQYPSSPFRQRGLNVHEDDFNRIALSVRISPSVGLVSDSVGSGKDRLASIRSSRRGQLNQQVSLARRMSASTKRNNAVNRCRRWLNPEFSLSQRVTCIPGTEAHGYETLLRNFRPVVS